MTVSSLITKAVFSGNGSTKIFPITFEYNNEDEVGVYLTSVDGDITKITTNILIDVDTDQVTWPVSGVATGVGTKLTIVRETALDQGVSFSSSGYFTPTVIEQALDELMRISQELSEKINRCIKYGVDENPTAISTETFLSLIEAARDLSLTYKDSASTSAGLALASELASLASETAAALSAAAALISQGAAATSETNAGTSETNASISALAASVSEAAAAVSASDAEASATNSSASATASANSAIGAAASETAAAVSESNASNSATAASAAVAAAMWSDVLFLTNVDSPFSVLSTHKGKLLSVDCSGGPITINLPEISTLNLATAWVLGIKKTDVSAGAITVSRASADTVDGNISKVISSQDAGAVFIPDIDPSPDAWTTCDFGAGGGGVGAAQGTRQTGLSLSVGTQIVPAFGKAVQTIFVKGNGGPIISTHSTPIAIASMAVGQIVDIVGTDNVNTYTLETATNLELKGTALLLKDCVLTLIFLGSDGTNIIWAEKSRNF